jgi:hypothetical protein
MKTNQLNQFEIQLMKPVKEIENEVQLNYEKEYRIYTLKILMKKYKARNIEIYKSIQQEYLSLIR